MPEHREKQTEVFLGLYSKQYLEWLRFLWRFSALENEKVSKICLVEQKSDQYAFIFMLDSPYFVLRHLTVSLSDYLKINEKSCSKAEFIVSAEITHFLPWFCRWGLLTSQVLHLFGSRSWLCSVSTELRNKRIQVSLSDWLTDHHQSRKQSINQLIN